MRTRRPPVTRQEARNALETETGNFSETEYSLADRFRIRLISCAGYWAIRLIGGTLRWKVEGWEGVENAHAAGKRVIYTFWHGRTMPATYFFRDRGIVVMTSRNRDGEYIARVIQRFGFGAARGSSSRGGSRALVELIRAMRNRKDAAFTIDGPRGPRYVAKPGAAYLAWKSGGPVIPFHISAKNKWVFPSWDRFMVPKPFSPTLLLIGAPIYVNRDAGEAELEEAQARIQTSLDDLRYRGDSYWGDPVEP